MVGFVRPPQEFSSVSPERRTPGHPQNDKCPSHDFCTAEQLMGNLSHSYLVLQNQACVGPWKKNPLAPQDTHLKDRQKIPIHIHGRDRKAFLGIQSLILIFAELEHIKHALLLQESTCNDFKSSQELKMSNYGFPAEFLAMAEVPRLKASCCKMKQARCQDFGREPQSCEVRNSEPQFYSVCKSPTLHTCTGTHT